MEMGSLGFGAGQGDNRSIAVLEDRNQLQVKARLALALICLGLGAAADGRAQPQPLDARVIVLSDTSDSMKQNDPKNAVVLVSRLFADIVPGTLGAVRLLSVGDDKDKIGMAPTGKKAPCPDNPAVQCDEYNFLPGAREKVVGQRLLISTRPTRGDPGFKAGLRSLLRPSAMDTEYALSWATVARFFDDNPAPETTPRVVVWLSDGGSDDWPQAKPELQKLLDKGVQVESLIFKSGETKQVSEVGIRPSLVDGSPGSLMKAFADAFRRIAGAPYRVDGSVAANPKFTIKPHMEDVWVVVYGDESLSSASVSGGGKTEQASYASDHYNGAAYRVALLKNPPAGEWTVSVSGGGPDTSYAVIQRSTITPHPVAPKDVFTGVPFKLDTTLRTASGEDLVPADLPEPAQLEAIVDGQTIPLHDDGSNGHYIAMLTAARSGPLAITVHAHNSFFDQRVKVTVDARGYFRYHGGPVTIDFGSFKAGHTVCRPLSFVAEQEGAVPFELRKIAQWPAHLDFALKGAGKHTSPGGSPIPLLLQDAKEICLAAGSDADNSESHAQSWVSLSVSGRQDAESMIDLRLSWSVHRLTFWEKWSWLILMILGALLVFFIIYGYIKPFRFPPGLALCFAPAIDELDDQTPQPVRLWRGVGIGFYRNARACLHDTFRINGKVKGSVAILQAGPRRSVIVKPQSRALYRDIGVNEWDPVAHTGRRASQGEIYRVGDSGPYFRISMRMNV